MTSVKETCVIEDCSYGKSSIKLLHVTRKGEQHTAKEFEVDTKLKLASRKEYVSGDNSEVIATDTQKNVVYVLAKKFGIGCPEDFGLQVCNFFLENYEHVKEVEVRVSEYPWERLLFEEGCHNHAYAMVPSVERTASVRKQRDGPCQVVSGLDGLKLLKTTKSAFQNFHRDQFRTLADSKDRIFSTAITATWTYSTIDNVDFNSTWAEVRDIILYQFAGSPKHGVMSTSVQNTLFCTVKTILNKVPKIEKVTMVMPNRHYLAVDFSAFPVDLVGSEPNDTVYLPIDKPSGFISATLSRTESKL